MSVIYEWRTPVFIFLGMVCGAAVLASAGEAPQDGVAKEAKSIVEAAAAYVRAHSEDMDAIRKALRSDPAFLNADRGLYVFLYFYDASKGEVICAAHGAREDFIGKNLWNVRTADGRFVLREIIEMVEKREQGWMEYKWLHPIKKKVQVKQSYIIRLIFKDGRKALIGCGFWK